MNVGYWRQRLDLPKKDRRGLSGGEWGERIERLEETRKSERSGQSFLSGRHLSFENYFSRRMVRESPWVIDRPISVPKRNRLVLPTRQHLLLCAIDRFQFNSAWSLTEESASWFQGPCDCPRSPLKADELLTSHVPS